VAVFATEAFDTATFVGAVVGAAYEEERPIELSANIRTKSFTISFFMVSKPK
jgi:hypothetical protein